MSPAVSGSISPQGRHGDDRGEGVVNGDTARRVPATGPSCCVEGRGREHLEVLDHRSSSLLPGLPSTFPYPLDHSPTFANSILEVLVYRGYGEDWGESGWKCSVTRFRRSVVRGRQTQEMRKEQDMVCAVVHGHRIL